MNCGHLFDPLVLFDKMWLLFKEEFEDTKGVIRIRISKNRQHNGQKKKDKQQSRKHTHKRANKIYVLLFIAHFH